MIIDRLSGRVALLIVSAVVLLVLLVGWFAFISPQRSKAASLNGQIASTEAQIASTEAYLNSPAAHPNPRLVKQLKLSDPANTQMSQILRELSAYSQRTGVSIQTVTPGLAVPSAGGQAVPITMTVQGHYFNLANFLRVLRAQVKTSRTTIHATGRLYSVDQINFTGSGNGNVISASLQLNAFISTAAPPPPVAPTTTDTTTTG